MAGVVKGSGESFAGCPY